MTSPPLNNAPPVAAKYSSTYHHVDMSRFWAVLVGIDKYPVAPLRGCVSDAIMVAEYLTKSLGVQEDHIWKLLDTPQSHTRALVPGPHITPTRANIIDTLLSLSTDSRIGENDNILIYFSGHGSVYHCKDYPPYSDTLAATGTIEVLCPIDRNTLDGDNDNVNRPIRVPDISDREINTILAEISRNKGHQITVILDCCHSAGLTRDMQGLAVRAVPPLSSTSIQDMFTAADRRLGHLVGYQSISAGYWRPNMKSHVVLAACQAHQLAKEVEENGTCNGVFTRALISALKSVCLNSELPSYYDLLRGIPANAWDQTPVVAGRMQERIWYQVRIQDSTNSRTVLSGKKS